MFLRFVTEYLSASTVQKLQDVEMKAKSPVAWLNSILHEIYSVDFVSTPFFISRVLAILTTKPLTIPFSLNLHGRRVI